MLLRKIIFGICIFMMTASGAHICAEESEFEIKQGFFVGLSGVYNSIGQDFDDTIVYTDGTFFYSVPEIDSGYGFGVTLGYRTENYAIELTYQRVEHDTHTTFPGVGDQTGYYNVVDLNLKYDILAKDRIRPYALIGFGAPWLDLENGRRTVVGSDLSDETFIGYSVNFGAGLSFYLTPRWFVHGTAMYRWQRFKQVDNQNLQDDEMAGGMNYMVGIAYTF